MSRLACKTAFVAGIFLAASAHAQNAPSASTPLDAVVPAASASTLTPPAPPPAPTPVAVDPSATGIDAETRALSALSRETAREQGKLKLLTTQAEVVDFQKKLGAVTTGTGDIPELVGLKGVRGRYQAEFLSGNAVLSAGEGDWVTSDWRVDRILPNGVQMSKKGGKETHTILFGHQPVKGGAQLLEQRQPTPSMPQRTPQTSFNPQGH